MIQTTVSYQVSGKITDSSGKPIAGVKITIPPNYSATTDTYGNYAIGGLPVGIYTLTPTLSGKHFVPQMRTVSIPRDSSNQNFSSTP
jgi:hypothetical protein